jgi:putative transposase
MLLFMYRVILTDQQRKELRERTRQVGLASSTRDRLEMVRLSDAGWSVPKIARHIGQHEQTVRTWIKAFLHAGFDALPNKPRGGKHSALTSAMLETVRTHVAKRERTWTAAQLADWVEQQHGVRLSTDRMRVHLRRAKISWQRTSRSLNHKQDLAEVAHKQATLDALEKKGSTA